MTTQSRAFAASVVAMLAVGAVGCSAQLPAYEEVRSETEAAMQDVVDALPEGSTVDDRTDPTPFACSDGGAFFTGHWEVHPPQGLDTRELLESLPEGLGDGYREQDVAVTVDYPLVRLVALDHGGAGLDVSGIDVDTDDPIVNIVATSRCAREPGV